MATVNTNIRCSESGEIKPKSIQDLSFEDRRVLKKLAPVLFYNHQNKVIPLPDALMLAGAGPNELRSLDRAGISESDLLEHGKMFRLIIMSGRKIPPDERDAMISSTEKVKPIAAYLVVLAFNIRDKMEASGDKIGVLEEFLTKPLTLDDISPWQLRT